MTMPNFLLIGAAKAGTSSLYYYLKQHPQVFMPDSRDQKEPDFFSLESEENVHVGPMGPLTATQTIMSLEDYQSLFRSVTDEIAIGEASTSYIYTEKAPVRIHHYIPGVKLIAILRDPVKRAFFHFLFAMSQGWEPIRNFEKTLREEEQRIAESCTYHWYHKNRGFHYKQLKRYCDLFSASKIKVYLYEDLRNKTLELMKDIFEFLEVDPTFFLDTRKKHNPTIVPKNETLNSLLNSPNLIKDSLKLLLPSSFRKKWQIVLRKKTGKPKLPPRVRRELIEEYREDISRLQDLIHRDLSIWLTS